MTDLKPYTMKSLIPFLPLFILAATAIVLLLKSVIEPFIKKA